MSPTFVRSRFAMPTVARRYTSTIVSTPEAPAAIGPYSQGVKANGMLYVSGCLGLKPDTMDFPSATDVAAQTEQAMQNMGAVLKEGQSGFEQVVKTTVLLADMADFPVVNEVYAKYFP